MKEHKIYQDGQRIPREGYYHICPNCAEAHIGRKNKKFCDSQCRNEYNNHLRNQRGKSKALMNLESADNRLKLLYQEYESDLVPSRLNGELSKLIKKCRPEIVTLIDKQGWLFIRYALQRTNNGRFAVRTRDRVLEEEQAAFQDILG